MDAFRAGRRVAEMMGERKPHDVSLADCLLDLSKIDAKRLLADYHKWQARFGTAPFDPDGGKLKFFSGGFTVWSGFPGAGKTTLLRQFICHCLHRGSCVFLASLEESSDDIVFNLAATASGTASPSEHQVQWFADKHGERLKLWDAAGDDSTSHRKIIRTIAELAGSGVRHAVIDSLMCLDIANDDFERQRVFANYLSCAAKASGIHIHLVAHPRKLVSATQEPDINDVAGARELAGIADNVLFVRRLKTDDTEVHESTPMVVAIKKQRYGSGFIGNIGGWFNRTYRQFHQVQFPAGPTRYLPDDAYVEHPLGWPYATKEPA